YAAVPGGRRGEVGGTADRRAEGRGARRAIERIEGAGRIDRPNEAAGHDGRAGEAHAGSSPCGRERWRSGVDGQRLQAADAGDIQVRRRVRDAAEGRIGKGAGTGVRAERRIDYVAHVVCLVM